MWRNLCHTLLSGVVGSLIKKVCLAYFKQTDSKYLVKNFQRKPTSMCSCFTLGEPYYELRNSEGSLNYGHLTGATVPP